MCLCQPDKLAACHGHGPIAFYPEIDLLVFLKENFICLVRYHPSVTAVVKRIGRNLKTVRAIMRRGKRYPCLCFRVVIFDDKRNVLRQYFQPSLVVRVV